MYIEARGTRWRTHHIYTEKEQSLPKKKKNNRKQNQLNVMRGCVDAIHERVAVRWPGHAYSYERRDERMAIINSLLVFYKNKVSNVDKTNEIERKKRQYVALHHSLQLAGHPVRNQTTVCELEQRKQKKKSSNTRAHTLCLSTGVKPKETWLTRGFFSLLFFHFNLGHKK